MYASIANLMIEFVSQVPVLNDVRDITLARNGLVALVSYEDKVRRFRFSMQP